MLFQTTLLLGYQKVIQWRGKVCRLGLEQCMCVHVKIFLRNCFLLNFICSIFLYGITFNRNEWKRIVIFH